jgi:hypothetical protein
MMKIKKPIAGLMFAALAMLWLQSCENDVLDITESFTYENEFIVYSTDTVSTIVQTVDIAAQSSIISEYGNKIKSIEITGVTYWLTMHQGADDQKIVEGHLRVSDVNDQGMAIIATISDVNLNQLVDNPEELPVEQDGLDRMGKLIKNSPYSFKLIYSNACNKGPLNFTVKFSYTIIMTANPIK